MLIAVYINLLKSRKKVLKFVTSNYGDFCKVPNSFQLRGMNPACKSERTPSVKFQLYFGSYLHSCEYTCVRVCVHTHRFTVTIQVNDALQSTTNDLGTSVPQIHHLITQK
jgi:hypothetical protein